MPDRPLQPPWDAAAERAILCSMMLSGVGAARSIEDLAGTEFYSSTHRDIFEACKVLYGEGKNLDVTLIHNELKKTGKAEGAGGQEYLAELFNDIASAANIDHYIGIVKDKYTRRRAIEAATAALRNAYDDTIGTHELVTTMERNIYDILVTRKRRSAVQGGAVVKEVLEKAYKQNEPTREMVGWPTGYYDLDAKIGGFRPGQMVIVAGRPSMGKTTLALNLMRNMCIKGDAKGIFFSLEMGSETLAQNLLAAEAQINTYKLLSGNMNKDEKQKVFDAAPKLYGDNYYIDDVAGLSIDDIRIRARTHKREHGLDIIFVDYLQLVAPRDRRISREQQVAEISLGLKNLAKDLHVPVVLIAQLNRKVEERPDHKPVLANLRESGALEQDADLVLLLYRPSYYPTKDATTPVSETLLEVIVAKNRIGRVGTVNLVYFKEFAKMDSEELERG